MSVFMKRILSLLSGIAVLVLMCVLGYAMYSAYNTYLPPRVAWDDYLHRAEPRKDSNWNDALEKTKETMPFVLWLAVAFFALNAIVRIFGFARGSGFKVLGFNYLSDFVPPVVSVCGSGKRHKLIGVVSLMFLFTLFILMGRDDLIMNIIDRPSANKPQELKAATKSSNPTASEVFKQAEVVVVRGKLEKKSGEHFLARGLGSAPQVFSTIRVQYRSRKIPDS